MTWVTTYRLFAWPRTPTNVARDSRRTSLATPCSQQEEAITAVAKVGAPTTRSETGWRKKGQVFPENSVYYILRRPREEHFGATANQRVRMYVVCMYGFRVTKREGKNNINTSNVIKLHRRSPHYAATYIQIDRSPNTYHCCHSSAHAVVVESEASKQTLKERGQRGDNTTGTNKQGKTDKKIVVIVDKAQGVHTGKKKARPRKERRTNT